MKYRIIGDIHGKLEEYFSITEKCENSIQIGDFGMGFFKETPQWEGNHKFIRGNHDNPEVCKKHPKWISDGTVINKTMLIGGAWSIDAPYRKEGISWWRDEELLQEDFNILFDVYKTVKPEIMITHDAPKEIIMAQQRPRSLYYNHTMKNLQRMFDEHKPAMWIYGHWHNNRKFFVSGCFCVCLAELAYVDIDI